MNKLLENDMNYQVLEEKDELISVLIIGNDGIICDLSFLYNSDL